MDILLIFILVKVLKIESNTLVALYTNYTIIIEEALNPYFTRQAVNVIALFSTRVELRIKTV